jgi:galactose mutarotase-like enzyme
METEQRRLYNPFVQVTRSEFELHSAFMDTIQGLYIILENDCLRAEVSPAHGAAVRRLVYKPANLPLFYESTLPAATSGRTEHVPGGWFECFPNDGTTPGRGREWSVPFTVTSAGAAGVTLEGRSPHAPLTIAKTYALPAGANVLSLSETVTNPSDSELAVFWGQHIMLGAPFYGADTYIETSAASYFDPREEPILRLRWPLLNDGTDLSKVGPGTLGAKLFYLSDFAEGRYRVVSPRQKLAFEMKWDALQFPYCWLMENTSSGQANWWGNRDSLCLNPFTGLPQALREGHGLLTIPARGSVTARFEVTVRPS